MKTYHVFITRISYSRPVVMEIRADNEKDACKLAMNYAGDYEYSEKAAEYELQAEEEAE